MNEFKIRRVIEDVPYSSRYSKIAEKAAHAWACRDWKALRQLGQRVLRSNNVCTDWRSRINEALKELKVG
jgi:hypothetical protein